MLGEASLAMQRTSLMNSKISLIAAFTTATCVGVGKLMEASSHLWLSPAACYGAAAFAATTTFCLGVSHIVKAIEARR
jgi:hypothetical protein